MARRGGDDDGGTDDGSTRHGSTHYGSTRHGSTHYGSTRHGSTHYGCTHHDEEHVDGEGDVICGGGAVGLGFEAEAEEGDGDEDAPHELHHTARLEGDGGGDEEELAADLEQLPPEDVRLVRLVRGEGGVQGDGEVAVRARCGRACGRACGAPSLSLTRRRGEHLV